MSEAKEATPSRKQLDQAREALQSVLARSATDPEFRARLLSSPREALAECGHAVPDSVSIAFVDNKADATFVLPTLIDPAAEVSEHDLAAVAGGSTPMCFYATVLGTIAVLKGFKTIGDDDEWFG